MPEQAEYPQAREEKQVLSPVNVQGLHERLKARYIAAVNDVYPPAAGDWRKEIQKMFPGLECDPLAAVPIDTMQTEEFFAKLPEADDLLLGPVTDTTNDPVPPETPQQKQVPAVHPHDDARRQQKIIDGRQSKAKKAKKRWRAGGR